MSDFSFVLLYGVSFGLVLALISIGLVITMGLMRVVNMAHGAFAAIGGYVATALMVKTGAPFLLAALLASVGVAGFSVLIERALFTSLYNASELDQVLLTIGLDFFAIGGLIFFFGPDVYPTPMSPSLLATVDLGIRTFEVYRIVVAAIGIIVIGILWFVVDRTSLGARLRAAVDNRGMAEACGINVPVLFATTFAVGSGLAAFGGAIGAPMLPLEPWYPFKYLTLVLIVVSLSGHGSLRSVFAASILIGLIETAGRYFLPDLGAFFIYFLTIGLVVWRPDGLLTSRGIS